MLLLASDSSDVSKTTQTIAFAFVCLCGTYLCEMILLIKIFFFSGHRVISLKMTGFASSYSIGFMLLQVDSPNSRLGMVK